MSQIQHFLLIFDNELGELIDLQEFGKDTVKATNAYTTVETEYAAQKTIDVVLIGSDSLETIKVTHANYFGEPAAASSRFLAGI
jgi:hypothetical protein